MHRHLISIVIPVFNEEKNIPLVYRALQDTWKKIPTYDYEFIFVDDGSRDGSVAAIEQIAALDAQVKCIEFSRNFGKEMATTAGLEAALGDAVIMLDSDLQHPPELIPLLIAGWEKGAEIVVGVRTRTRGVRLSARVGSWCFHKVMGIISETHLVQGETDFRLVDRAVVDAYKRLSEHERMTRSLINWLGFKKETVPFEAPARLHGEAQYSTPKLIHLALYTFVTNSLWPLRLAGYLGTGITAFSGILGIVVVLERYVFHDALSWHISGSAQLAIITVFLIGIVLMCLGLIALYIGTIHTEVSARPLYVVRKRVNLT